MRSRVEALARNNMENDLEALLRRWRDKPLDRRLDQLEPRVWAQIDLHRRPRNDGVLRFRAALAASMLGVGALAGGVAGASTANDRSPFAIHSAYAPSTLLEGRQ